MPIYMKFEGIVGPVKGKYAGWIELESCQFGNASRGRPNESGSSTAKISDLSITKLQDTTSAALFRSSTMGTRHKVTIDFVNGDGVAYLTLELSDALIVNMSLSGSGGERAMESLTLNFTNMTFSTKPAAPAKDADPKNTQSAWNMAAP